jgi:hypothetical protein
MLPVSKSQTNFDIGDMAQKKMTPLKKRPEENDGVFFILSHSAWG